MRGKLRLWGVFRRGFGGYDLEPNLADLVAESLAAGLQDLALGIVQLACPGGAVGDDDHAVGTGGAALDMGGEMRRQAGPDVLGQGGKRAGGGADASEHAGTHKKLAEIFHPSALEAEERQRYMNIIILGKKGQSRRLDLGHPMTMWGLILAAALLLAGSGFAGFGIARVMLESQPLQELQALRAEVVAQRTEVAAIREQAQENLNALSVRLGQLNAHVIRLDALGDRLTRMAGLEEGEFSFQTAPAQGGPEVSFDTETEPAPDLLASLDVLESQLVNRAQQLTVLENLLMNRNLQDQVMPAGRPITKGWLSSYFGVRNDPFTGKRARHYGLDFAGAEGAEVIAVAAGVVTYSGPRYGYGNMVEINHGNGFVTRYAHNKENLVGVGDVVKKGQIVAYMGSSGRSTGPHVHFEVLQNGKVVNPLQYIRD